MPSEALQPKTTLAIDEDFTSGGKCTSTDGKTLTGIISQSCFYDLCLGSPTDCINIYAGTGFNFQPISSSNFRSSNVNSNSDNNGILDPEQGTPAPTPTATLNDSNLSRLLEESERQLEESERQF